MKNPRVNIFVYQCRIFRRLQMVGLRVRVHTHTKNFVLSYKFLLSERGKFPDTAEKP